MELVKLSEAYTLVDNSEKWMTSGNVTKETSGNINITINSTLKMELGEDVNRWGSLFYSKNVEGGVSANYNFDGAYKEDFVDYCEELVAEILETIK